MFPIIITRTLNPFWRIIFNKGWWRNEYLNNRIESRGFATLYVFKKAIHILYSYKWYCWWLSGWRPEGCRGKPNDILYPFGIGYPKKKN